LASLFVYAKVSGPPPLHVPVSSTFYAKDGTIIGKSGHNGIKREWVPLENISPELIEATIAIEDKRFYHHHGFDFKRIIAAIIKDMKAMEKKEGASTITQQYARNLFLSHEKTWMRKLKEALYTIRLEFNYSKDDILEGYLNTIYYGHGAYGIEAAANYYFQKSADALTLSEASMLAGIPKGPSYYSPEIAFSHAKKRQETVLDAMADNGFISETEQKNAQSKPIELTDKKNADEPLAPYFLDAVKRSLIEEVGLDPQTVEAGGLSVYTTLDPQMQKKAKKWVEQTIDPKSDIQAALVAIDPKTGGVKAMIGGRNYKESRFNRATQARRAPGSTFKPFLYYAALENGFNPSTPLLSEKTTFRYQDGRETYSPKNYGDRYANDFITLAQALAISDNIYAVKTHMLLGPDKLVETAKRFGITSPLAEIPSLALGTKPVGVLEMAHAYATLANNGKRMPAYLIEKVIDSQGNVLYEHQEEGKQTLDEDIAFVTTALMTGIFDESLNDYAQVTGASINHLLTRPMAGKSGTTATDSWMIGFTPQLVTAVWTGYDVDKTLHPINDSSYAKKIWANFMEDALENKPNVEFRPTKGVVGVRIDPDSGKRAAKGCPKTRYVYYVKGTEPTETCDVHNRQNEKRDTEQERSFGNEKKWWQKWFNLVP